jgi:hypothetical protein
VPDTVNDARPVFVIVRFRLDAGVPTGCCPPNISGEGLAARTGITRVYVNVTDAPEAVLVEIDGFETPGPGAALEPAPPPAPSPGK